MVIIDSEVLKSKLLELKNITDRLSEVISDEEYESIDGLFIQRQKLINDIDNIAFSKEEFKSIAHAIDLLTSFRNLETFVNLKKGEMKQKIDKLKDAKEANRSYINNSNAVRSIFNTQV